MSTLAGYDAWKTGQPDGVTLSPRARERRAMEQDRRFFQSLAETRRRVAEERYRQRRAAIQEALVWIEEMESPGPGNPIGVRGLEILVGVRDHLVAWLRQVRQESSCVFCREARP